MTTDEIKASRAICDAATPGPWEWDGREVDPEDGYVYVPQGSYLGQTLITLGDTYEGAGQDCDFIAHARTALPAALDEIERLRAALETERKFRKHAKAVLDGEMGDWADHFGQLFDDMCAAETANEQERSQPGGAE